MIIGALMIISACSSDDAAAPTTTTTTGTADTTTTTRTTTPSPSDEQAAQLEVAVAEIYPDVPDAKATDWARSTCSDMLRDEFTTDELIDRTIVRFSGGSRPDPTREQANAILDIIESQGWCTSGAG